MKEFLNRNRRKISLILGFALLFTYMGYGVQPKRPWLDWFFFTGGVIGFAVVTRIIIFALSIPLFYGPLLAFFIFGGVTSVILGKGWADLLVGILIPIAVASLTWGVVKIIGKEGSQND